MVSTSSSAGWPAASSAARTAPMRLVTPVEVSLCTTATALIARSRSSASRASIRAGSAPVRQSPSSTSTSRPSRRAIVDHSVEKCPVSHISTASPGESVFTSAASQAPVPDDGKISTWPRVAKMSPRPASTRFPRRPNSGPRWSMVGRSMARRIRSGTLVGPGICRKCRPAGVFMNQRLPRVDESRARWSRAVYAGNRGRSHSYAHHTEGAVMTLADVRTSTLSGHVSLPRAPSRPWMVDRHTIGRVPPAAARVHWCTLHPATDGDCGCRFLRW